MQVRGEGGRCTAGSRVQVRGKRKDYEEVRECEVEVNRRSSQVKD